MSLLPGLLVLEKSSLAFDTIYAEGQRRYIESLSSYARQFLGQMDPPDVESISGLSPAIAIDQKTTSKNPRSTVGTVTEIYDYMRVLYARAGTPHCPHCGKKVEGQTAQQIVDSLKKLPEKTKIQLLSPLIKNKKGEHKELIAQYMSQGFSRARIDGEILPLSDEIKLAKTKAHHIDLVIDRILVKEGIGKRLTDSVEFALKIGQGLLSALIQEPEKKEKETLFSENFACHYCDVSFPEQEPRLYSFNSPLGACEVCNGLGESNVLLEEAMILDEGLPLFEGAIGPLIKKNSFLYHTVKSVAKQEKVDTSLPYKKLSQSFKKILFYGGDKVYRFSFRSQNSRFNFKKKFIGMIAWLDRRYNESTSEKVRQDLEQYMNIQSCPACHGKRLNSYALATLIGKKSIIDICELPIEKAYEFFEKLKLEKRTLFYCRKTFKRN